MNIVSKIEAIDAGEKRYFTGIPCKNGHIAERYVKRDICVACSAARSKKWQDANPENVEAVAKIWRESNVVRRREKGYEWIRNNPQNVAASKKKREDKAREQMRAWRLRNKDKINARKSRREAAKLQATPAWANKFYIGEIYHLAQVRQRVCGGSWHVDHIVPLRSDLVCGLHCEANLQVVPGPYNQQKSNVFWPDMPD